MKVARPGASILYLWLAVAGCAYCAAAPGQQTPVIVISIDTLRADHLSAYGYRKIRTPSIDSFAAQGTLFTEINSQIPLTLPSHTSLFTSTYPFENRIEENAERVPRGVATLASVLRSHGYRTAAFIGSVLLDRRLGLDQGFDFYDSPFKPSGSASENPYSMRVRRDGALVVRAALQWLRANRGQPIFVFVHLFDLHTPYMRPADFAHRPGISGYDSALLYVDHVLGGFQRALVQDKWWDRALVVVLSDHGESLGDHGESSHGYFTYQSTLWVPLILHWPSGTPKYPSRVSRPAGLIEVAPTILDFLHLPAPPSFEGESLLRENAEQQDRAIYSESMYTYDAFGWAPLWTVRVGSFKYIDAPRPELYDLQLDPREQTNLLRKNPAEALALRNRLRQLLARSAPRQPASAGNISPQTRALLGSLGYIGRGPHAGLGSSGPDPKDRLPEYNLYEKGLASLYDGRLPTAISIFHQVLTRDPHNALARCNLADAYLRLSKPDDALHQWSAVLADDPKYAPAAEAIAELWLARQDFPKARTYLQQVVTAAPGDYEAQFELGILDERLGATKEALEHLQAACKLAPDSAQCQRELTSLQQKMK